MRVGEILADWLKQHGYDGLYSPGECGCPIDNLAPCESMLLDCEPGWRMPCDCGDHDYHIGDPLCKCGHPKSLHDLQFNGGCRRVGCGCKEFNAALGGGKERE